jgi:SAM-dependent methyltransferase
VNQLLESRILKHDIKWHLSIAKKFRKEMQEITDPESDKQLSAGYLEDLNLREYEVNQQIAIKWVEFFVGLVSLIGIIPYICSLINAPSEYEIWAILLLGIVFWVLVFNRTYFNKHPIIMPLDVQQTITHEFDARKYREHSLIQTSQGMKLIDLVQINSDDYLLDLGCGDGRLTKLLAQKNNFAHIVGVDKSQSMIEAATEQCECLKNVELILQNFLDLSLGFDGYFTIVYSSSTVHWIGAQGYDKIFQILKTNGSLLVEQAGDGGYVELHRQCLKALGELNLLDKFNGFNISDYYFAPTEQELNNVLKTFGFSNINIQSIFLENDESTYQDFAVASLLPYFDVLIDPQLCDKFSDKFLETCYRDKPKPYSTRFVISATKPG